MLSGNFAGSLPDVQPLNRVRGFRPVVDGYHVTSPQFFTRTFEPIINFQVHLNDLAFRQLHSVGAKYSFSRLFEGSDNFQSNSPLSVTATKNSRSVPCCIVTRWTGNASSSSLEKIMPAG